MKLGRQMEQRIKREQTAEDRRNELKQMIRETHAAREQGLADLKVEGRRMQRQEAVERREIFSDYIYVKAEQEKAKQRDILEIQERLAKEIARRKSEEARNVLHRQQICDGSEELRALKEKLNAARVSKVRALQMLQRQAADETERQREAQLAAHIEDRRLQEQEDVLRKQIEKDQQYGVLRQQNQAQMADKERQRIEAKVDHLRERAEVEALVQKIAEEDVTEILARQRKQEETKQMLVKYAERQFAERLAAERREAEEDASIEAFQRKKRDFELRVQREREQQEAEKRRVQEELAAQQMRRNKEAEEMERLREDLVFEERQAALRRQEQLQAQKKLADQVEMSRAFQEQLKAKDERRRREMEQEQLLRDELMAKFAEDDRIEQMNAQKRRMKLLEHKKEVDKHIEMRRAAFQAERQRELEELGRRAAMEAERQEIIRAERQRLLQEQGPGLRDFLPKGVLQDTADFELVGAAAPTRSSSAAPVLGRARANEGIPGFSRPEMGFAPPSRQKAR